MPIIDTHAHLDHLPNLDQALINACEANVEAIVAVSMDLASCQRNLEIKNSKQKKPTIYLAMGIHPEKASLQELEPCEQLIRKNLSELSAIGEIGLDFWYKAIRKDKENHEVQRKVFRSFLELAKELNLPVVIHSRGTWAECLQIRKEIGLAKAVFHWYSGPVNILKNILEAGYLISASPALAYSSASRDAVNYASVDQILIETDSPVYFGNREAGDGFEAQPKDVWRSLKALCELKGLEENQALNQLNSNAKNFFNIKSSS